MRERDREGEREGGREGERERGRETCVRQDEREACLRPFVRWMSSPIIKVVLCDWKHSCKIDEHRVEQNLFVKSYSEFQGFRL